MLRWLEQAFRKWGHPLVFLFPNNPICLFAGAARMRVWVFAVLNVTRHDRSADPDRAGSARHSQRPIDAVLDFVARYRVPILIVSVLAVGLHGLERDAPRHLGDRPAARARTRARARGRRGGGPGVSARGTAVVTGASSGIGAATARHLAAEGLRRRHRRPPGRSPRSAGRRDRRPLRPARRHRRQLGRRVLRHGRALPRAREQRRRCPRPRLDRRGRRGSVALDVRGQRARRAAGDQAVAARAHRER